MSIAIAIYEAAGALAAELRRFWDTKPVREKRRWLSPSASLGEATNCFSIKAKSDRIVVEPLRIGVHTLLLPRVPAQYAGVRVVLIDPTVDKIDEVLRG